MDEGPRNFIPTVFHFYYRLLLRKLCDFCCSFQLLTCASSDFLQLQTRNIRNDNFICGCLSRTFDHTLDCFVEISKHEFRPKMFATAN